MQNEIPKIKQTAHKLPNEMKQQQRPQRQLQQCYTNNNTNNNLSAAHIVEPRHTCTSTHKLNKLFFSCYALNEIRSVAKNRREREKSCQQA